VGDPLDRDSDYYKLVVGQNRWWDPSDTASVNSESFNRYAAWLGLWNVLAGKRWVLWQIPIGNSNHLDVCNNGKPRQGYKDNRAEYFFGTQGTTHSSAWAGDGVIGLLFGAGASCQSSYQNDQYTDGKPFLQNHVGSFYASGGLPLALGGSSGSDAGTDARSSSSSGGDGSNNAPTIAASASVSPTSVGTGATVTISATVTVTTGAMSNGIVDVEVYDPSGTKVGQDSISGQSLSMGQSKTYPYAWTAPATTGTFTVKVGVFGANWTPLYSWNGSAATIGVVAGDPAQYGFETGTQGWASAGSGIASVASSTAQAFAGGHSLAVNIAESGSGQPMVAVSSPSTPAGAVVTFHVFIPAGSGLTSVQPFALQGASGNWTWTGDWQAISSVKAGAWNTIQVTVPSNAATPLHELGVQFATSAAWTGTAYVDSVGW
jgi:hypothetical protein